LNIHSDWTASIVMQPQAHTRASARQPRSVQGDAASADSANNILDTEMYKYPSLWRLAPFALVFVAALLRSMVDVMITETLPVARVERLSDGQPANTLLSQYYVPQPAAVSKDSLIVVAVYGEEDGDGPTVSLAASATTATKR
jgi:hypothetical protein